MKTIALSLLIALGGAALARAEGPADLFNRAGDLYAEGEYEKAVATYESLLRYEIGDPDIHYNAANAYFKTGRLGWAILHYRKALRSAPRDADTRANLELAQGLIAASPNPDRGLLESLLDRFTPNESLGLAALSHLLLGLSLLTASLAGHRRLLRAVCLRVAAASLLLLAVAAPLAALHRHQTLGRTLGVIVEVGPAGVLTTRTGPSEDQKEQAQLPEGLTVEITRCADQWCETAVGGGVLGWAPKSSVAPI